MKKSPEDINDIGFCIEVYNTTECAGCLADDEPEGSKFECCGKVNVRKKNINKSHKIKILGSDYIECYCPKTDAIISLTKLPKFCPGCGEKLPECKYMFSNRIDTDCPVHNSVHNSVRDADIKCKKCGFVFKPKIREIGHFWGASTTMVCIHKVLSKTQCPRCYFINSDNKTLEADRWPMMGRS